MPPTGTQEEHTARAAAAEGNTGQAAEYFRQAAEKAELADADSERIIRLWRDCAEQFYLDFKFSDSIVVYQNSSPIFFKFNFKPF